jgi:formylglycine-generating enzyme required for sulfatase activity
VQHRPYALARHPVTVGAYARFLEYIAADDRRLARAHTPPDFAALRRAGERRPMRNLRAIDAEAYCRWMSEATGVVVRLPLADEWEVAARGADMRAFPWGDRFDPGLCASLWGGDPAGPPPEVGTHPADCSPFGLEDAAGNVWEWTATDCGDDRRLVVGGSVLSEEPGCRVAARRGLPSDTRLRSLGFRVLRELPC